MSAPRHSVRIEPYVDEGDCDLLVIASTTGDPSLVHRCDDFKRQIRLPSNQRKQKGRVRFQGRDTAAARFRSDASRRLPALHPFDCRTGAHVDPVGRLAPRRA
jgi:hypothetical protein